MPPSHVHPRLLQQGRSLQMQGRRDEAAALYRQVLADDPQNPAALYLLGVLLMEAGQLAPGVELLRQSLAIQPGHAAVQEDFGRGLELLGRSEEALDAFDRLIVLAPQQVTGFVHRSRMLESLGRLDEALRDIDRALALNNDPMLLANRAVLLAQLQRPDEAVAAFDAAIAAGSGPAHPALHFNRGVALMGLGRLEAALASYDDALRRQPDYGDAWVNRGAVLESLGRMDEALDSFDRALAIDPQAPQAQANRLALLARTGRAAEALALLDAAIAAAPGDAMAYANRGVVLNNLGDVETALGDFDRAIALQPDVAVLHSHRGTALQTLGRFDAALDAFDRAIALAPAAANFRLYKSLVLLLLGRFADGLPLYELRARPAAPPGLDPAQAWAGPSQSVAGKTVLVYAEQGLGDVIQFSRYLIDLSALGANIVLAVRDAMAPLLRSLPVPVTFIPENTWPAALDFHAPLLSLPFLFGTRVETIAAPVPYLQAEAERVAQWRARLGDHGFRIAIAWQGATTGSHDARRAFPVASFAPLAALPGVRLISLQKGEGREQLDTLPTGMAVERLGGDFDAGGGAFLDAAAVMEACDLVVTLDTSIAHLAGALGRPVWTALKHVPDWRWLLQRADTPWYPTMTLYRQPRPGDWESVFAAMAHDLDARLAGVVPSGDRARKSQ